MGGTRSVRLKRPSVPFLALLLERDFIPPSAKKETWATLYITQVPIRLVLPSKRGCQPWPGTQSSFRLSSSHNLSSLSPQLFKKVRQHRLQKQKNLKREVLHLPSAFLLTPQLCRSLCSTKREKKPFTRRFQRARAYIALYKLTQHRL